MTIDINKAKAALATLEREKQAQRDRLQHAAEAKLRVDNNNAQRTLAVCKRAL